MIKKILFNSYLYKNFSFVASRIVIKNIINFIVLSVLLSKITKSEYGIVVLIGSYLATFSFLSLDGLGTVISRNVTKGKDIIYEKSITMSFISSSLIIPILLALALYHYYVLNEVIFGATIVALASFIPINMALSKMEHFFLGKKRFDIIAYFNIFSTLDGIIGLFILLYFNSIWMYIITLYAVNTLILFLFFLYSKKYISYSLNLSKEYLVSEISYGYKLTFIGMLSSVLSHIDKIIIGIFTGLSSLAGYALANRFYVIISGMIKSLCSIPSIKMAENNELIYKRVLSSYILFVYFTSTIFFLIVYILSPYFIIFFFPEYGVSLAYFKLLCFTFILSPMNILITQFLSYTKRPKALLFLVSSEKFLRIFSFPILFYFFGVIGIVYSFLVSEIYWFFTCLLVFFDKFDFFKREKSYS